MPVEVEPEVEEEEVPAARPKSSSLESLIEAGLTLLTRLGTLVAEAREEGRSPLAAFLDTDEKTGQSYLKVPMPDPKVVEGVVSALGPLLDSLGLGRQG
jgi:hypothetical protein